MNRVAPQNQSTGQPPPEHPGTPFVPSVNCRALARADRLAFLVDAEAYFRAFKRAALEARRSILIVAWEVNPFTELEFPSRADPTLPNALGPFLLHLLDRRPALEIRLLVWKSPPYFLVGRELTPRLQFDWLAPRRLTLALDPARCPGGSHHQKLVVIDDDLAFVGGLDLTIERLDSPEHRIDDPEKRNHQGKSYPPHHDIQVAVDGPAATALAQEARDRWHRATGERLPIVKGGAPCWPDGLEPSARDVDTAIARSLPEPHGKGVREIEQLYLDAIAMARDSIYIENQFFTATRIVEALLRRLQEPDGPEIVVLLPRDTYSWLAKQVLEVRQFEYVARLREADPGGRLAVYSPVQGAPGGTAIKVHAKAMIIDGRYVQVGSANLANRSMGLDSECDIAVCPCPAAASLRDRLLAEHLGCTAEDVAARVADEGSLIGAIEALRGAGRSLVPYPVPEDYDTRFVERAGHLLDPTEPITFERLSVEVLAPNRSDASRDDRAAARGAIRLAVVLAGLTGLAVLWRWGPLAGLADATTLMDRLSGLGGEPSSIAAALVLFVLGSLTMFPLIVMLFATGLLLGPWTGLAVAGAGSLGGAFLGYVAGAALGRRPFRRFAGARLDDLSQRLAQRGVLSVALLRLMPVAPFTLVNMIAGASHIRLRDFMLGSALGLAPAVLAATLFAGQLSTVLRSPGSGGVLTLAAIGVATVAASYGLFRRYSHRQQKG